MILVIDVTVGGPNEVMTGSTAVTVNAPAAQAPEAAPPAPDTPGDLESRRMQMRSQALRWSGR